MGLTKTEHYVENINFLAELFATLGHPARLSILFHLRDNFSATVGQLKEAIPLAQSTISEHVRILKKKNLIKGYQIGTSTHYSLHAEVWPLAKEVLSGCAEEF